MAFDDNQRLVPLQLALHVFLLAPLSDLLTFLRGSITLKAIGSPADDLDVAFVVAKRMA